MNPCLNCKIRLDCKYYGLPLITCPYSNEIELDQCIENGNQKTERLYKHFFRY